MEDTMEKFIIIKDEVKRVRRYNLLGRTLEFQLKDVPQGAEPLEWIKEGVNQIILKSVEGLSATDQVGFTFNSNNIQKGVGWLRFRQADQVTLEDVWEVISNIYQSNSTGLNTETFGLTVTSGHNPK